MRISESRFRVTEEIKNAAKVRAEAEARRVLQEAELLLRERAAAKAKAKAEMETLAAAARAAAKAKAEASALEEARIDASGKDEWFYLQDERQFGPVSLAELRGIISDPGLSSPVKLVWAEGMEIWRPVYEVRRVCDPDGNYDIQSLTGAAARDLPVAEMVPDRAIAPTPAGPMSVGETMATVDSPQTEPIYTDRDKALEEARLREVAEANAREESRLRADAEAKAAENEKRAAIAEAKAAEDLRSLTEALAKARKQEALLEAAEAKMREELRLREIAEAKVRAEALRRAAAEAKAAEEARIATSAKARAEEESKAKAVIEAAAAEQARVAAVANARAEEELKLRKIAEANAAEEARIAACEKARAEEEARMRREAEARAAEEARQAAIAKARSESDAKAKSELEARALAEARFRAEENARGEARRNADALSREDAGKVEAAKENIAESPETCEVLLDSPRQDNHLAEKPAAPLVASTCTEANEQAMLDAEIAALAEQEARLEMLAKERAEKEAKAKADFKSRASQATRAAIATKRKLRRQVLARAMESARMRALEEAASALMEEKPAEETLVPSAPLPAPALVVAKVSEPPEVPQESPESPAPALEVMADPPVGKRRRSILSGRRVWYHTSEGERVGPVTFDELKEMAQNGSLNPRLDLVWKKGSTEWLPAGRIDGLFQRAETGPASPADAPRGMARVKMPSRFKVPGKDAFWPGARRRGLLLAILVLPIAWKLAWQVSQPALAGRFGAPFMEKAAAYAAWVPCLVILYFIWQRLVNLGMSRWWSLAALAPVLNLWVGYRCFACPRGYAAHHRMDAAGVLLGVAYWAVAIAFLTSLAGVSAPWSAWIDSAGLESHLARAIRSVHSLADR